MSQPRNRIRRHVRVRAGELVAHEMNPRVHSEAQRELLRMLYDEVGFARSLLAYELPDGRLKLIDGHLRASLDPGQEVEVEVLDVTDAEARRLLLSIDPLALLAQYEAQTLSDLRALAGPDSPAVRQLWEAVEAAGDAVQSEVKRAGREEPQPVPEQWLVLIECDGEAQQVALLKRFQAEGLRCKALLG
jgi:hypothetical protein